MRAPPRGLWLGLAGMLIAAGMLLGPVLGAPTTRIIGNFQSEAATHAPVLAAALEGLLRHGPFVLAEHPLYPDEVNGAMYEPITTLLMWPVYTLAGGGARGFTLAWNVWHLVVLVASGLGGWIWARAWLGDERDPEGYSAAVAMTLASASVFLHLAPEVGRTEAVDYPLYALHGGLLFRAARRGGAAWIAAALSAVPILWAGGYAAVFFAVVEPFVAVWALVTFPRRRATLFGLAGVAVVAAAAVAPLAWALEAHPYIGNLDGARQAAPSITLSVLFVGSQNLLRELPGYEAAPFVGFVALLGAVVGVARLRAAAWPLGIALVLAWVAAGPDPVINGNATWGPAALLADLPAPVSYIRGWSRIIAFAIPLFALATAAASGGRALPALLLVVCGLGETARLRTWPASWWSLEEPARLTELRAAGELPILLPIDGLERTRRWVAPAPGPDVWKLMVDHEVFHYFQDALPNEPELFRGRFHQREASYAPCALLQDAISLGSVGISSLYVRPEFLPHDGRGVATRALREVFGTSAEEGFWRFPRELPEACAAAEAPAAIALGGGDGGKPAPLSTEEREERRAARRAEREEVRAERERQRQEPTER